MARILYVEDHEIFAAQACRSFLAHHEVTTVPSIAAANLALLAGSFEVLLVDYDLEDGKGVELLAGLGELEPRPYIVAVSSHERGNAALLQAGADVICGKLEFGRIAGVIEAGLQARRVGVVP